MAENKTKTEEDPNLQQMLTKSNEKASSKIARDQLIEKQNVEMKRLFRLLPFQIFLLVADADNKIDPKEVAQFREFLGKRGKHCSNQYTRRMLHSTVINYTALTTRFQGGHIKKDFQLVEKAMGYVAMCVPPKVMAAICKDLKDLAVAIAEASGGFMGMTSPISKEEQEVIDTLESIFVEAADRAKGEGLPPDLNLVF